MKRLRIVSDGTSLGTRVEDADTGEEVERVVRVDWHVVSGERTATAELTFIDVEVDVVGVAEEADE